MELCFLLYRNDHTHDGDHRQTERAEEPVIGAYVQLADHEWMHGTARNVTSKTEGTGLVGNKR